MYRNEHGRGAAVAVTAGAILPDAPMFVFYGWQKLVEGTVESDIWGHLYFEDHWQLFFDIFNSIPLMLLLMLICRVFDLQWGLLLAGSALLHLCCDLPVHHDDAHRHFLPLTHWRFASPVSYWDPDHHGMWFMLFEFTGTIAACVYVMWKGAHRPMRWMAAATLLLYASAITFAAIMWLPQLVQRSASG